MSKLPHPRGMPKSVLDETGRGGQVEISALRAENDEVNVGRLDVILRKEPLRRLHRHVDRRLGGGRDVASPIPVFCRIFSALIRGKSRASSSLVRVHSGDRTRWRRCRRASWHRRSTSSRFPLVPTRRARGGRYRRRSSPGTASTPSSTAPVRWWNTSMQVRMLMESQVGKSSRASFPARVPRSSSMSSSSSRRMSCRLMLSCFYARMVPKRSLSHLTQFSRLKAFAVRRCVRGEDLALFLILSYTCVCQFPI